MSEEQARRLALNEAVARDVNEIVERLTSREGALEFRCECAQAGCRETVRLTREEYASVRADSERFVVVPGHEHSGVEKVVGHIREYPLVEKRGAAGRVASERAPAG